MPNAYGYARVTTGKQRDEGLSVGAQKAEHRRYFDYRLASQPDVTWAGTFVDGGVSAFKKKFKERKAGKILYDRMAAGDHLIVTKMDRLFRSLKDGVEVMEKLTQRKVTVHFIREGIDVSTPMGRFTLHLMLAFAELEREMASERTAAVMAHRKKQTGLCNQHAGYGFMVVGHRGKRRSIPDVKERAVMGRIVELHDVDQWRFEDVYAAFLKENLRTRKGKPWSFQRIKRAYRAELALRAKESLPPSAASDSKAVATASLSPCPAMPSPTGTTSCAP